VRADESTGVVVVAEGWSKLQQSKVAAALV
jgi:hypothetical protein